jgi:hypothetical protein
LERGDNVANGGHAFAVLIQESYGFYTKVAKSAKEPITSNSFFADLAIFV